MLRSKSSRLLLSALAVVGACDSADQLLMQPMLSYSASCPSAIVAEWPDADCTPVSSALRSKITSSIRSG
jgi:hypothetical protein